MEFCINFQCEIRMPAIVRTQFLLGAHLCEIDLDGVHRFSIKAFAGS